MSVVRLALGVPLPQEEIVAAAMAIPAMKVSFFIVFLFDFYDFWVAFRNTVADVKPPQ
jgi:hypothetical protein